MVVKRRLLTEDQFRLLKTTDGWNIDEVPSEHWSKIPGLQRLEDTVGIMASGSNAQILNGVRAVVGIDVLVHERNPMIHKNEPEGNAYHYVVQKINDSRFPYILHGPFKAQTIVPHWFEADALDVYWNDETS